MTSTATTPVTKTPAATSRRLRLAPSRRRHGRRAHSAQPRSRSRGLMACVDGKLLEIHGFIGDALKMEECGLGAGTVVDVDIIPRDGFRLLIADAVSITGAVTQSDDGCMRIGVNDVSYSLISFLMRHLSGKTAVMPHVFS